MYDEPAKHRKPNRLSHEKSPYLLQHAHNPVDWYPWGEEALEKAKQEDKPIFLSIGYSTCHWCHVMARESFEDEEVAKVLNEGFISIKVDREERPDVDQVYMTVCQAMTGQGGWPLTIIMTPEQKPFFAGTYLPKQAMYGRMGLMDLLGKISKLWKEERNRAYDVGDQIVEAVKDYLNSMEAGEVQVEIADHAYEQFASQFDEVYGGFGSAPKFPRPHDLLFLLRYYRRTGEPEALQMVTTTLDAMRRGGIFDHLGYGFARYSVDREWLVPHFEKMLYDNALLAIAYLETFQVTKEKRYADVAREIFQYVLRDMKSPEGAFFSAEDADSEGVEGKFYVWTPREIANVLGENDGGIFCQAYGVTEEGNFEHQTSILNQIGVRLDEVAETYGLTLEELQQKLSGWRRQLFAAREKRVHPGKDDKILTSWNGLMIAALARGARVMGEMEYADAASRAARFISDKLVREDGRLLARYRDGEAAYPGYLDDYAFLAWGLMELYEATFQPDDLERAVSLTREMLDLFRDKDHGGLYFYGKDAESLFARPKEIYDGAMPSGNSVAALNLIRLARLTSDQTLIKEANRQIRAFARTVEASPISYSFYLMALLFAQGPGKEIVISGPLNDEKTKEMIRLVQTAYLPEAVIAFHNQEDAATVKFFVPQTEEKPGQSGEPRVYICENYACQAPISDVDILKKKLR
ncbi:thioredoxin domain-containing protein [Thermoactinomyces mirandus]|uniref:Thioredoxin domain-containing protein n=1 Tax=Thermoactinomyces mirandus TaxID=2756294 RepID=A0A7W2ATJ4_9BACL|nr:thioredoxin domain-containing protein [Thermoactinomyces mirandus]MBA4603815.1 thioredoxin domain-containing protein [Thermoactinomyces mirandus]